jgi:hypothetical protein
MSAVTPIADKGGCGSDCANSSDWNNIGYSASVSNIAIISPNGTPIINDFRLRRGGLYQQRTMAMPKSSPIFIRTIWAAVFALSICKAPARDIGQWDGVDPLQRQWFNGLMRPDNPRLPCCGPADAYWADSYG